MSGLHHSHYHLPRMTEMGRVFWTHSLGIAGAALVSVFVPIYLLNLGYDFRTVLLFIFLQHLTALLLQYPAARLISRLGANKGMVFATGTAVAFYALLLSLPIVSWPLPLVAMAWGLDRATYWLAFHVNFSKSRAHHKTGRQVSAMFSVVLLAHGIAPAIGGAIATVFGIGWVYAATLFLLIISAVPLLTAKEVSRRRPLRFQSLDFKRLRRDPFSNFFNGLTTAAELFIWPLIIFLIVKTYAAIGALSSTVALTSMAIALYVGRREESKGERHYLRRGLALETVTNVFRAVAQNASHVFSVNLISGVSRSLYATPYLTRYYRHADEEPRLEYVTLMELGNLAGSSTYLAVLLALSFWFSPETVLLAGVLLAAPASFGIRLVR